MFDAFPILFLFLWWFGLFCLSFCCANHVQKPVSDHFKYKNFMFQPNTFPWIQPAHRLSAPVILPHFLPEFLHFYFVTLLHRGNCFNELFLIPREMLIHSFHLFHSNTFLVRIVHFLSNFDAIILGYFCFDAL